MLVVEAIRLVIVAPPGPPVAKEATVWLWPFKSSKPPLPLLIPMTTLDNVETALSTPTTRNAELLFELKRVSPVYEFWPIRVTVPAPPLLPAAKYTPALPAIMAETVMLFPFVAPNSVNRMAPLLLVLFVIVAPLI